ncbi:hypothetical protein COCCADRAFT_84109, partial [Bipolaris zeicola 26-R-13]
RHAFYRASAPSRDSSLTSALSTINIDIDIETSPSELALPPIPACPGLCSAQPFISERRSFAVSSSPTLLDVLRRPRLAKDAFPPLSRNLPCDRSRHQKRTAWTLLRHAAHLPLQQLPHRSTTNLCFCEPALTGGNTR